MTALKNLNVLVVHNNKLTAAPEFLADMPQLLRLALAFNPMARADSDSALPAFVAHASARPGLRALREDAASDLKPSEDFRRAFEEFVETRDLSRSKATNFTSGPFQAKVLLMRQHRDALMRLFGVGRLPNTVSDNADAIAAHDTDPKELIAAMRTAPTREKLLRLLAAVLDFQDSWFALWVECGGFDELLRLLHRIYVEKAHALLVPALQLFQATFDAVWKTVLTTHSSVPILLLHLDAPDAQGDCASPWSSLSAHHPI